MSFDIQAMVVLHGLSAAFYAALAGLLLLKRRQSRTGFYLALAALVTSAWALSVALSWKTPLGPLPRWLELARGVAWYGFILHLYLRSVRSRVALAPVFVTMGLVATLLVGGLPLLDVLWAPTGSAAFSLHVASRLALAVGTILLIENLYRNTDEEQRWHINLLCVALGGLALYDLVLYADAALFRRVSPELFIGRASVTALAAPLLALAAARNRRWDIDIHVSRQAVFHSATLVLSGIFLLGLAAVGEVFRRTGAEWGLVAEMTLVFAGILAVAVLLTSGSTRSRLRTLLVDHFFSLRYDYRREWMRCIETLSAPETYVGLHTRAVRALAEVVDSPAGALYVRDPDDVAFCWAGSWNLPAAATSVPPGHKLIAAFRDGDWIVELGDNPETLTWLPELPRTWLVVPLRHLGSLLGFVVLARSRAPFTLDREVFELLRVISREVAGRVAEQRAARVLQQTRELREYTQRFAFVIHDIKNVSGQLTMLLSNAEIHAGNPEFQRDMLTTVRASVARITRLLTRLQPGAQERAHALITPVERLEGIVETFRRTRGVTVTVESDAGDAGVAIDPDSFDAVVVHLLNNAVEAGGADGGVRIVLRQEALSVLIDIVDTGPGMSAEFVRDELFRPFATTKRGGHGIGAYQARELLRAAGGDLLVLSQPGAGTTMRLMLPSVHVPAAEASSLPA
jgi:putative PEP-CTERM system histidine kinase